MKLLNTHEKWKIGLTALAVTGVALGSILLLTKDLFKSEEEKPKADAPEPAVPRPESFVQAEQVRSAAQEHPTSLAM